MNFSNVPSASGSTEGGESREGQKKIIFGKEETSYKNKSKKLFSIESVFLSFFNFY
jgi:hypothetical protein